MTILFALSFTDNVRLVANSNHPAQVIDPAPYKQKRKRISSFSSAQSGSTGVPIDPSNGLNSTPSSMPDLQQLMDATSGKDPNESLPTTPTLKPSSSSNSGFCKSKSNGLCKKRSASGSCCDSNACSCNEGTSRAFKSTPPLTHSLEKGPNPSHRPLTEEEVQWAFSGLKDLNMLDDPNLIKFIESLPKSQ